MAEKEATRNSNKRKIRQPPSVPFLWEERPGIAKKDWKPGVSSVTPTLPPPIPSKFIPSDPFNWEEKPGTPLPSFSQPPVEPAAVPPQQCSSLCLHLQYTLQPILVAATAMMTEVMAVMNKKWCLKWILKHLVSKQMIPLAQLHLSWQIAL